MSKIMIALTGRGTINNEFVSSARVGKDEVAKYLSAEGFRSYSFALPLKQTTQVLFGLTDDQTWNDQLKTVTIKHWELTTRTLFQRLGTEGGRHHFDSDMWAKMAMLVWDDVKQGRENTTTHTADVGVLIDPPKTKRDFDFIIDRAVQTMFQLSDYEMECARVSEDPLPRWSFNYKEAVHKMKYGVIPATMGMEDPQEAWIEYVAIRKLFPTVVKASNGPYGTPPRFAEGLVIPDCRFENEADTTRLNGGVVIHVQRELPKDIELVQGHASEKGIVLNPSDLVILNDGTLEALKNKIRSTLDSIRLNVANDINSPS
jgi:hypothetical protein